MALTDPIDTLAYHNSRVLCMKRDMSHVPCKNVAKQLEQYQAGHSQSDNDGWTVPETQALWFYGMNHGVSLISSKFDPLEPLPEWAHKFVAAYHDELTPRAVRAFYYLLLICTREARHNKSLVKDYKKIADQFGKSVADFFMGISGGESSIHQKFVSKPPEATIGQYVDAIRWQFYNSKWNSGYGGPAWGKVTDCLCRFVNGEFSAEMMLDTIWTLAHNNGPIFNKGIFYKMYNYNDIIRILDVQRSGQIPQAILSDDKVQKYSPDALKSWMIELRNRFPNAIGNYVDWYLVESLGAVGSYWSEKNDQVAKHGISPVASEIEKKKQEEELKKKELEKKKQEEFLKTNFQVMPGVFVKKIEMVRAA